MKSIHHISIILILALLFSLVVSAPAQDKVGTSAAPFLGINIGAAATAMGGAYVSLARDASALYWNPGAISRIGGSHINFTHTSWFLDTDYNWGAVVINLDGANAIGLNLAILDYGEEEVTTVHEPEGNGQRWSAQDLFAAVAFSRNLTDRFSIGGAVKYIQQKIYNESASGYAIDLGLLYITRFRGMRLGVSISNFGTDMRMDGKDLLHTYDQDPNNLGNNPTISSKLRTDEWPLPLFYRVGVSMDVLSMGESALMLSTDAVIPSDNSTIINVGGEFNWNQIFFLRAGYKSLLREETQEGLAAGVGFKYFVPGLGKVSLDYAFNDYGLLEEIHTLGFGFSF
ncbi:MAG: hypothetical protein Kow0042_02560 [Calditrichia bacterium]